jgi:hypothetical protein
LGTNFVCAQAGEAIKRIKNTSFFIGFSRRRGSAPLNRIGQKKSIKVMASGRKPLCPFAAE